MEVNTRLKEEVQKGRKEWEEEEEEKARLAGGEVLMLTKEQDLHTAINVYGRKAGAGGHARIFLQLPTKSFPITQVLVLGLTA